MSSRLFFEHVHCREATTIPDSLNIRGIHVEPEKMDVHVPHNYDYGSVLDRGISPCMLVSSYASRRTHIGIGEFI
jgi:hypothetical protein